MRRTWRTQQRRLIAGTVGLAMGIICLADRADSQAMTEVTFIVVNNLFSTPAFVAVENGYWTTQGLNVKIKLTSSGRQVTQSLQAGEAQFGHAALSTTTAVRARERQHAQRRHALLQCRRPRRQGGRARHHRPQGPRHRSQQSEVDGRQEDRLPQGQHQRVYMRQWFKREQLDISKSALVNLPVENMPITLVQGQVDAGLAPGSPTPRSAGELGAERRRGQPRRSEPP